MLLPENQLCADCGDSNPRWCSTNLGIFICISCSGCHRALGAHISKVLSATLDEWKQEDVQFMQSMGNKKANEQRKGTTPDYKISVDTPQQVREAFIRAKYEGKPFVLPTEQHTKETKMSKKAAKTVAALQAHAKEWTGVLAIRLLDGTNLPVKDLNGSSDPYVVFKIGTQKAKSKTIKKNLNPVWNENLMLHCSIKDVLKVEAWDEDTVSSDDSMAKGTVSLSEQHLEDGKMHEITLPIVKGHIRFELTYTALSQ
jgi:stromal membrane-associated protein